MTAAARHMMNDSDAPDVIPPSSPQRPLLPPMPLIPWSPDLEVGVDEIDHQHRTLVTIVNRLYEAIVDGREKSTLNELIKELEHYTGYHFATEEALMKAYGYEFMAYHQADHRSMSLQIRNFLAAPEQNFANPQSVFEFLQHWLIEHIAGADRHLGEAIRNARQPLAANG